MTRKQIYLFIVGLLAVSWVAQLALLTYIGGPSDTAAAPFMIAIMFLPGLFGLLFAMTSRRVRQSIQWRPKGIGPFAFAIVIPALIAFGIIVFLAISGMGQSDYFRFGAEGTRIASGPWILGIGDQSWPHFAANILFTMTLFAAISSLATIGEEFGWRGVLQNSMIREFGVGRGVTALGVVWALWHAPIVLSGYNYPDTPVLGAFVLLPLLLIFASFVLAWLTLWSGSFWPAVLMHGAINSVYDSIISRVSLTADTPQLVSLLEIGLFALVSILIFWRTKGLHATLKSDVGSYGHQPA